MNDSRREDPNITTADIARPTTPRQARAEAMNRSNDYENTAAGTGQAIPLPGKTANGSPAGVAANTTSITDAGPLFPDDELHNFRARWDQVQTSFVDEPRKAVEQADNLVANVVQRIAEQFANERTKLEGQWSRGDNVNTEDLRQALKRYRSFFDRLLSF
jgi:hypothetical protein